MGGTFKSQGSSKPTAMGTLLQASAYGQTIPKIYGMTQSPLLFIWAANLRLGGGPGSKKFKNFKKGVQNYIENIDALLGHNPIRNVNRVFVNGTPFPTEIVKYNPVLPHAGINYGPIELGAIIDDTIIGYQWITSIALPHMWAVIAVTITEEYTFDIDDFGGQGPQTLTGTYERPFWNELEQGPDPTFQSGYKNYPYCYRWATNYTNVIFVDAPELSLSGALNVYLVNLLPATSEQPPIARLGFIFENELGNGPEFADAPAPFNAQQIIYPQYAGLGSSDVDLGASGSLPQILPEVMGKWGIYPTGDCDYVDIIADVIKSGLAQASIGGTTGFTQQETGLSSYDYPGLVQLKMAQQAEGFTFPGGIQYNLPNTAGNFLVVIIRSNGSGHSISSSNGESWTTLFSDALHYQVWYATAVGGEPNFVTIGGVGPDWIAGAIEMAGCDTLDAVAVVTGSAAVSVTSTVTQGLPAYLLSIPIYELGYEATLSIPNWELLTPVNQYGFYPVDYALLGRKVRTPGTYSITQPLDSQAALSSQVLFAFKCINPASYPRPLGDFLDDDSLELTRLQCRANGLWGSLSMNTQSSASDWLKSLYQAANAAPVFLGSKLYTLPYSEVSTAGNGAKYTSPTAAGPIANLSDLNGDFISGKTPVFDGVDRIGTPNVLQLQIISREANYNQLVVAQPESASMALYSVRKADPVVNNAIQDAGVARMILGIMIRKNQYGGDVYSFTLPARWMLLSPMDLVAITDSLSQIPIVNRPVRLTSVEEQSDRTFECEAEPFIYGMYAPTPFATSSPTQNIPDQSISAGDVNPPIIFEPVPGLYPGFTGDQLWVVVSSADPNYGGCQVLVSVDGGASYISAGDPLVGSAVTGHTTNFWPSAADPDSTNDLGVDVSECSGTLTRYGVATEDAFTYPCYVQGGNISLEINGVPVASGSPLGIQINGVDVANMTTLQINGVDVATTASADFDYELMTYSDLTLTGPSQYTLLATGTNPDGSANKLRRAVFDAPAVGTGVDHPIGSRFAVLSPGGTGILKLQMPSTYIGQLIFFKILSFNTFANALQDPADVVVYSYTPTGIPGGV